MRSLRTSSLLKNAMINDDEETDKPAWLSSYINTNMSEVFRSNSSQYKDGREPLAAHFDSGTRLGRLVIDANGRFLEHRPEAGPSTAPAIMREDVRAIVDFPSRRLRAQAGDLYYPVKGFQVFRPMAGAALFTQFSMDSSRLTLPSGNYEVFLARPSKVIVYINGAMVQVLDLPAGRHNLRDFPFSTGLNDLRLEIMDDMGRTETKNFTYFSSSDLLKPGLSELSYAVGVPSQDTGAERVYDSKRQTVSISHRQGLTQKFTLGANYQGDSIQTVAGLEALLSTSIGFFSIEPAYSTNKGKGSGYAGRFRYIMQEYNGKEKRNMFTTLEATLFSSKFAQLGSPDQRNPSSLKTTLTHSRVLSKVATLNLSVGYDVNRKTVDGIDNSYNISAGLSQRWSEGLSTTVNLRHTRTSVGKDDITLTAFLIWALPADRQYVTASHDTSSSNSRADWTYQSSPGVGGFTAQMNTQKRDTGTGYGGMVDYIANRARMNVSEEVEIPAQKNDDPIATKQKSVNTTNLRFGTALVFAGGHFSISRPVTDSFAILVPQQNLKGQNVQVNPQTDGSYIAETDWMGSAVHPEMPSYSINALVLNQKNLRQGVALPRDHFQLRPRYHSGYAIDIGSDAVVYLKSKLLTEEGTPIGMVAGRAVYLEDESKEPVTVFTNRSGLLRSEGFRHGRYRLEISEGGSYEPVEFVIPDDAGEEFDLPPLKLKAKR